MHDTRSTSSRGTSRKFLLPLGLMGAGFAIFASFGWNQLQKLNLTPTQGRELLLGALQIFGLLFAAGLFRIGVDILERRVQKEKVSKAETRVAAEPEKTKPAWDLARLTLEYYFNRNLSQISWIFWLSVLAMFAGFCATLWGVSQSLAIAERASASVEIAKAGEESVKNLPAIMAAIAGVITQFIGATFLFVYRSTIQQAASYSKTLERINSVGMAMQILDTMPDETKEGDLKSQTKAKLIEMLVKGAHEERSVPESPRDEVGASRVSQLKN